MDRTPLELAVEKYVGDPAMFIGVAAMAVAVLPFALAADLACAVGKLLGQAASAGYELARGNPHRRELRRTIRAHNETIGNIAALHNHALREMERVTRERRTLGRGGQR